MATRTGTKQARKLGLDEGSRVLLVGAPPAWSLADPPTGVEVVRLSMPLSPGGAGDHGAADLTILFVREADELVAALDALAASRARLSTLWICWPRRAGGHGSDLTDGVVRSAGLALGLVDNKVAAVDADWSGLRFVRRRERR
ncbi:MAG: DUF3052 domain-containing protein [Acidimicrobiales bacterium]